MAKSQSESSLLPLLGLRGARGVTKLTHGFAEGKRTMPGPGKMPYRISSPSKGED